MTTLGAPRVIYEPPELLADRSTSYCPGCGHGVVHRLIAEVLGELGVGPRTIAVAPVGCAVFAYDYLRLDFVEAPHGRAPTSRPSASQPGWRPRSAACSVPCTPRWSRTSRT